MYKRGIVNFLFLISFPVYGMGIYISALKSPSLGYIISITPHLLILSFYFIDLLYRGEFESRLNATFYWMIFFLTSSVASLFIALGKGLPESTLPLTLTKSMLLVVPFFSFLIVVLYNEKKEDLTRLTLISLSALLAINLVGYFALGLSNETHSIEGRLSFPFLDGFYSGASLLVIINLLLLYHLKRFGDNPFRFVALGVYFLFNLALIFQINSRLTILVFLLVLGMAFFRILRLKGVYLISLFTVPILLTSGLLLYQLLQIPALSSLVQRVDVRDVTTFNGRAFLWRDAMDWLLYDQRGLFFGNGHKGHYFLNLISDVAKLWNEKNPHHMHLHSTSLELLVSQGIVSFGIFAFIFYQIYSHFKILHRSKSRDGSFLPVVIFLLFVMQVDTFLYIDALGFVIFSLLVAQTAIQMKSETTQPMRIEKPARRFEMAKAEPTWGIALT